MDDTTHVPAGPESANHDTLLADVTSLRHWLSERIVGQTRLVDRLLIAMLAGGHLLVEGAPGLAKTTAIKALAAGVEGDFQRIQFTPDLLPADLTGTEIWRPQEGRFEFQPGPLFHNLLLADEINRAPAKVQSALLEAMGERQITVGRTTYRLPELFLVMATQNPIEQEGTFPLPEAQLDRFLMHVLIGYPDSDSESRILALAREQALAEQEGSLPAPPVRLDQARIRAAQRATLDLHLAPALERYIIDLVLASRDASGHDPALAGRIAWGASPRGTIALERCARARAWLNGRDYVSPEDVRELAPDVLRHRILPSYEATAEGWDGGRLVAELLERVAAP